MNQQTLNACLAACNACAIACNQCAAACLRESDVKMMARCVALDMDCAAVCQLAAAGMARKSDSWRRYATFARRFATRVATNAASTTWIIASSALPRAASVQMHADRWRLRPAKSGLDNKRAYMKSKALASSFLTVSLALAATAAIAASPYAGQESREIKALSPEDVSAYEAGKGMGFAKTAELNGFAGPAHVLELATQLQLTPDQRDRTEALFTAMQTQASASGRSLVARERELDTLFAARTITPTQLAASLQEIATLQSQIRDAHLHAHLAQVEILTPEQNTRYALLRGYGPVQEQTEHHHTH